MTDGSSAGTEYAEGIDCPFCGSSNVGGVALTSHDYWCKDCKSEFKKSYIKHYTDTGNEPSDGESVE